MRIALNIHALYGGGAERLMAQLANRWAETHEVHLVTWSRVESDAYPLSPGVVRHGLDLLGDSPSFWHGLMANRRRVVRLRDMLQEIAPQFVLSFADQMNIVTLEATKPLQAAGVPVWIAEHSDPARQQLGIGWEAWRRRVYPRCTGCVVLTDGIADYLSRLIDRKRLRVIPPGIQLPNGGHPQTTQHASGHQILFVGRLSPEKRVDLLLDAWREVGSKLPDWQLKLVGDGPLRDTLEELARGLPRVEFVGWDSQPERHFQTAEMFVLCSDYEGFPVALLEALSHGLACISTDCTTAIEVMNAGAQEACLLTVPRGSREGLAAALIRLARSADQRAALSRRGLEVVREYAWERIGREWDQLLPQEAVG